jgi:bifunctional DNA-binding transcriptional regulator/antitoxin component of YhaV-PrlF toxin-antitoxin module
MPKLEENPEPMSSDHSHTGTRIRVDPTGRIVIPAPLRARWGIVCGQDVLLTEEATGLRLRTFSSALTNAQVFLRAYRPSHSVVDELIAERHAEAEQADHE